MNEEVVRISKLFSRHLEEHGPNSPHSVIWNSKESQQLRYLILAEIADLSHASVLDVGSGLGDLYAYFQPQNISYTGIELSPDLVKASRKKYSGIKVLEGDFLNYSFESYFDYVFCSGSLNVRYHNHNEYLHAAITKMYNLAKRGVAFNLPSNRCYEAKHSQPFEDGIEIAYVSPSEIFDYCQSLTNKVVLRHDYLEHDFTIYMYR